MDADKIYSDCALCPRACHADRTTSPGFCGVGSRPKLAKAMLHQWEEPCLAGSKGSGAIFFSGCTLKCLYCQNYDISHECFGQEVSNDRLAGIILELQDRGAETLEFITASQYVPDVVNALDKVRHKLHIPTIFNCGGYEAVETLRMLDGYIDIYLPDVKYFSDELAVKLSAAPHYFDTAVRAVAEMLRQTGKPVFCDNEHIQEIKNAGLQCGEIIGNAGSGADSLISDKHNAENVHSDSKKNIGADAPGCEKSEITEAAEHNRILAQGTIIRHLVLPGCRRDSIELLDRLAEEFDKDSFLISLLSQYTPFYKAKEIKGLNRRITSFEYESVLCHAEELGLNGFMQEKSSAKEEYTPSFDLEGIAEADK